jgi:hypothetical protein
MLKQLVAMAVIPPSPKISACNTKVAEIAIIAAHGSMNMAIIPPPTAWPELPPGTGYIEHHYYK